MGLSCLLLHRRSWSRGLRLLRGFRLGAFLFRGGQDRVQNGPFHARHKLHHARFADVLDKLVDDGVAELAMGHLAAAKTQAGLHLIPFGTEAYPLVLLGLVVVLVHRDRELDFLDGDDLLLFAGGAFALFLLIEKAAVVLNAADRWNGSGRHFHQIEPALASDLQRLKRRQNSQLFAVFVDDANFACPDAIVDADKRLGRTFIECDGAPPLGVRSLRFRGHPERQKARERTLSIALVWLGRVSLKPVPVTKNSPWREAQSDADLPGNAGICRGQIMFLDGRGGLEER